MQNTLGRFAAIFAILLVGFIAVLVKIFLLQVVEKDQWLRFVDEQQNNNKTVKAQRGNIYDDDGRLLASSLPRYSVHMDTRVEALHLGKDTLFYHYVDSIAEGMSRIIGDKNAADYRKMICTAFRGKKARERDIRLYPGRISYTQKKAIQQLPLVRRGYYKSGIHFEDLHERKKPFGSLGSRTIGDIYGESGKGSCGLEQAFDSYLAGKDGYSQRQRVASHWEYVPIQEAENGCDIHTTLDANLMDIVESALRERLEATQADWGCCILMEAHTGKIKAISNLDRAASGRYYEMRNHAVSRVEPGSTFKTISLMAALDDGKVNLYDTVSVARRGWDYGVSHHTDSHPKDTVYTLRSALAISSNIALAKVITSSYENKAEKFVSKLQKMGLKDSVYCEILGAQKARIDVPKDAVTLSKMSYGYSVELTPLQILTFYNGIANDGKMIRPYMVRSIEKNGEVLREFDTETLKSSMCRSSTLEDIRLALHDVVWDNALGTASVRQWQGHIVDYKAQSQLVHIAGKTGTAQLVRHGKYQNGMHRMTFVGYFPEETPQYTCICMIENPKNKGLYDAGYDCGKVVRQIAEKTVVYAGHYIIKKGELLYETK